MAGLPHAAQIIKISVDNGHLPSPKPAYTMGKWDQIEDDLVGIDPESDDISGAARHIVDAIPRNRPGRRGCRWWNQDLERMRDEVRHL